MELSNYRKELIQVAAVAVAMVQDDVAGSTYDLSSTGKFVEDLIIGSILKERISQENKWGPQHHSREKWLAILSEEIGEVAKEILENVPNKEACAVKGCTEADTAA